MVELIGLGNKNNFSEMIMIGALLGISMIFIGGLSPAFSLGIPTEPLASVGKSFTVGIAAPILEEFAFRGVLLWLLAIILGNVFAAIVGQAVAFSLFHQAAYGVAAAASFVGAGAFGVIAAMVTLKYRSLLPAMVMHAIFNGWLLINLAQGLVVAA